MMNATEKTKLHTSSGIILAVENKRKLKVNEFDNKEKSKYEQTRTRKSKEKAEESSCRGKRSNTSVIGGVVMAKMSVRYMGALDWLLHYEEYFYKDTKTKRIMMKPNAPAAAVKSFELYKEANNLHYDSVGK